MHIQSLLAIEIRREHAITGRILYPKGFPKNSLASILFPHVWDPSNRVSAVRTTVSNQFHSSNFNSPRSATTFVPVREKKPRKEEAGKHPLAGQNKCATFLPLRYLAFKGNLKASVGFPLETGDGRGHKPRKQEAVKHTINGPNKQATNPWLLLVHQYEIMMVVRREHP